MKNVLSMMFAVACLQAAISVQAAPSNDRLITMQVPDAVVADAMKRVLPLRVDGSSSGLEGNLKIVSISNFRVKDKQIHCHVEMEGTDLHLVRTVADQPIRLKLGSARMAFDCSARIRFDAVRQILYIQPSAGDVRASEALIKGDIGQIVLLLVDGRRFPVAIQNLKPVIAEIEDKVITLKTKIVDIRVAQGAFQLSLSPNISMSSR